jgi:tRNA-2-methylthio-N6-dimethylallyladenosine synthase
MVRKTGILEKYIKKTEKRISAKKIEYINQESDILNSDDKLFPRSEGKLDFTVRIEEIKYIPHILSQITGKKVGNDDKFDDYLKSKQLRENPASAQVIIQSGCDNYCSFCIVPYTRGKEISRVHNDILEECREAVRSGAKEITLIGQNVNSYGKQFVEKKLWNSEKSSWNNLEGKSPFRLLLDDIDSIK